MRGCNANGARQRYVAGHAVFGTKQFKAIKRSNGAQVFRPRTNAAPPATRRAIAGRHNDKAAEVSNSHGKILRTRVSRRALLKIDLS